MMSKYLNKSKVQKLFMTTVHLNMNVGHLHMRDGHPNKQKDICSWRINTILDRLTIFICYMDTLLLTDGDPTWLVITILDG